MIKRTVELIQAYQQYTRGGEFDKLADMMRDDIEDELAAGDGAIIRNDPQADPLKPIIGRILKDAKSKKHEKDRIAARGMNG